MGEPATENGVRLMWVFCCGMQRSGSTLQFQIAAHLVEEAGLGRRVEWVRPEDFPALREKHAAEPGWKVFKNHTYTPEMAAAFTGGHALGIYIFRDLRDVMVSAMHKDKLSFDQFWEKEYIPAQIVSGLNWTALPKVLVSRYEDVIANLPAEVLRIAHHLGIPLDQARANRIAAQYTPEAQAARIDRAIEEDTLQHGFLDARFDTHSLLHTDHLHTAGAGEWVHELTATQVARLEDRFQNWLNRHGYPLTISPARRKLLLAVHKISKKIQHATNRPHR